MKIQPLMTPRELSIYYLFTINARSLDSAFVNLTGVIAY